MSVHGQTVQARYWGNSNFHFIRSREVSYVNSYHPPGLRGTFEKKPNKRVRTKKSPQFGTSLQKCHVTKAKSPLSSLSQVFLEHCQGNKNVHTGSYIVDLGRRWRATTKIELALLTIFLRRRLRHRLLGSSHLKLNFFTNHQFKNSDVLPHHQNIILKPFMFQQRHGECIPEKKKVQSIYIL